jgi:signal transduction histidine kinase
VAGALADLRLIAAGLRSPSFEPLSVGEVVGRALREHEQRTGQAVSLRNEGPDRRDVEDVVKIGVYRVLQEALSNAARHAPGSQVGVTLDQRGASICLEVTDTGPGFDPGLAREGALGIAGMRERAELLGGEFLINRREDVPGTRVLFRVPVKTGGIA